MDKRKVLGIAMISRIAIPSGAHPWNIVYMVAERIAES